MFYILCIGSLDNIPVQIQTRSKRTTNKLRVLLADDHRVVLDALTDMLTLEDDIEVVGTETDGLKTIAGTLKLRPDILVMDIMMPGCDGISALQAVRRQINSQRVLILTVSEKPEDLKQSLQFGAQGYVLKRDSIRDIVQAIRRIVAGDIVLSNRLITRLIGEFRSSSRNWDSLNNPQKQVLQLFESGLTISTIAERISLDEIRVRSCLQLFLETSRLRLQNEARQMNTEMRNSV
jgi:two-component system, NarL family, response regulator DesR